MEYLLLMYVQVIFNLNQEIKLLGEKISDYLKNLNWGTYYKIYITRSYFLKYKSQAKFPNVSLRSESFQQELFSPPMKVEKSHKLHGTHLSLVATKNVSKEAVGLIFILVWRCRI